MTEAQVRVRSENGVAVVEVAGEIDIGNGDAIAHEIADRVAGEQHVIVDLSEVSFMDSQGIALLEHLSSHLEETGGRVAVVAAVASPPRRLLEIVDLGLPVFDEVGPAIAAWRSSGDGSAGR